MTSLDDRTEQHALSALKRIEADDREFHRPAIPDWLVHWLIAHAVMTSTLRWVEELPLTEVATGEGHAFPADDAFATDLLASPNALGAVERLVTRARRDCQAKALHPIGLHLRTVSRARWRQDMVEATTLTLSVTAVDMDRLEELSKPGADPAAER